MAQKDKKTTKWSSLVGIKYHQKDIFGVSFARNVRGPGPCTTKHKGRSAAPTPCVQTGGQGSKLSGWIRELEFHFILDFSKQKMSPKHRIKLSFQTHDLDSCNAVESLHTLFEKTTWWSNWIISQGNLLIQTSLKLPSTTIIQIIHLDANCFPVAVGKLKGPFGFSDQRNPGDCCWRFQVVPKVFVKDLRWFPGGLAENSGKTYLAHMNDMIAKKQSHSNKNSIKKIQVFQRAKFFFIGIIRLAHLHLHALLILIGSMER